MSKVLAVLLATLALATPAGAGEPLSGPAHRDAAAADAGKAEQAGPDKAAAPKPKATAKRLKRPKKPEAPANAAPPTVPSGDK